MLEVCETLVVRQEIEPLQVFSGLETENRYKVLDPGEQVICFAYEESGFMARQFLKGHRPLNINIVDAEGNLLMSARRRFFWFFSHLEFFSAGGGFLGRMQRRFSFPGRRFDLADTEGIVGTVHGPALRPNTFWLRRDGREMARITKQWGGLPREMFSAADTFFVQFTDTTMAESMRWLVLSAAFAIDLDFFEDRNSRSGLDRKSVV